MGRETAELLRAERKKEAIRERIIEFLHHWHRRDESHERSRGRLEGYLIAVFGLTLERAEAVTDFLWELKRRATSSDKVERTVKDWVEDLVWNRVIYDDRGRPKRKKGI